MMFDEVKAENVKSKMATIRIAKQRWVPGQGLTSVGFFVDRWLPFVGISTSKPL